MTGALAEPAAFLGALIVKVPALLLAVTIHELAHGVVADRLGDPTARLAGRLTLNPLPHIDPFGALAFVLAGFGWAKPVPVNAANLRHPTRDMTWVALAGPTSNLLLAFVGLLALVLLRRAAPPSFLAGTVGGMLIYVYQFNLVLAIFNLIPLPPLDGGHFLPYLFPRGSWSLLHQLERYGPFILLALVFTGAIRYIISPVLLFLNEVYLTIVRFIL